jgi:endonuclease/exonuclease/phosphatase family metal-dependent hydrolase
VLAHVSSRYRENASVVIAGDMNQPNERDYPAVEWAALSKDLARSWPDFNPNPREVVA